MTGLDTSKNIILWCIVHSTRGVFRRRLGDGSGCGARGREVTRLTHSGDPGAPSPATRSGCQELAEGLRPYAAECPKHGPGVSTNAAAERALVVPPPEWSAVRRGRRSQGVRRALPAWLRRRLAHAANRKRLAALHLPSFFEGMGSANLGAFRPRECDVLFEIRIRE
jgi:hypothetical protein